MPAFARALVARRRRYDAPRIVDLIFGGDWRRQREKLVEGRFLLAVNPRHYAPGRLDLRCVVGMPVFVYVRVERLLDERWRAWEYLVGELSLQNVRLCRCRYKW